MGDDVRNKLSKKKEWRRVKSEPSENQAKSLLDL